MRLANEQALWLLFAVAAILGPAYIWSFLRKARALRIFASSEMLQKINISASLPRQIFKASLLLAAFVTIVIAVTQPGWNPKPRKISRSGRDIVILLDTSRSMLAEDIKPNRLSRARIAIGDLLDSLEGDRIALVTFAGNSTIKCPLTQDYAFMRVALADIDIESTSRGGTAIGDAIRKASDEIFDKQSRKYKDIILITDGEDHESFPVAAAEKAAKDGIRIIAIGLGDQNNGARIPIIAADGQKSFLKYNGQEVWSKLNGDELREIAFATPQGKYLAVETGTFDLDKIYRDIIASAEKRKLESETMMQYDERFQVFLVLAILLIVCEILISERKKV
jgi:Ca-activated chloride channel family protein